MLNTPIFFCFFGFPPGVVPGGGAPAFSVGSPGFSPRPSASFFSWPLGFSFFPLFFPPGPAFPGLFGRKWGGFFKSGIFRATISEILRLGRPRLLAGKMGAQPRWTGPTKRNNGLTPTFPGVLAPPLGPTSPAGNLLRNRKFWEFHAVHPTNNSSKKVGKGLLAFFFFLTGVGVGWAQRGGWWHVLVTFFRGGAGLPTTKIPDPDLLKTGSLTSTTGGGKFFCLFPPPRPQPNFRPPPGNHPPTNPLQRSVQKRFFVIENMVFFLGFFPEHCAANI